MDADIFFKKRKVFLEAHLKTFFLRFFLLKNYF